MRLAWLVNLYPAVTHTFIRREIEAIERCGHCVMRLAHRRPIGPLPSESDRRELDRTRFLLESWPWIMLWSILAAAARPLRFGRALWLACRLGWGSQRGLIAHIAYLGEAADLQRWLRQGRVQHVHAHFGGNSAMVAMLCRMLGGPPFSFTVHGPQEFEDPRAIHLREKVRRCALCVAISDFAAGELRRICDPVDATRIRVVRCGVDAMFLDAKSQPPPTEPRFLFVGRLESQKNPSAAINAVARLRDLGHRAELTMIGEGPLRAQLEQQVHSLQLSSAIRLLGACDSSRVLGELSAARVLVLPSAAEGLPVVIMESLAAGRAVIATDVGGVSELLEHGVNGWLIQPGSVDELASAMLESLRMSPEQLYSMAMRGRERVLTMHSAERNARSLLSLICERLRCTNERPQEGIPGA